MDLAEWKSLLPEPFRDRLQLVREFTEGAQGRVFLCEDLTLRRRVVFKCTFSLVEGDPDTARRFEHEVRVLSDLSHPHIVRLFDGQATGSELYLITEYIEGPSLQAEIDQGGPLDLMTSLKHLLDICDGLDAAHQRGVVHRDLKPRNILLDRLRGPVLIDFGLARSDRADRVVTTQGEIVGTPLYMAPEVIMSRPATVASDIYALGLVMHFMLSGQPAFGGRELTRLLEAQVNEAPPRLEGVPPALEKLVSRCLAKAPTDRPQSTGELVEALVPIVTSARDLEDLVSHSVIRRAHGSPGARDPDTGKKTPELKSSRDFRHTMTRAGASAMAVAGLFAMGYLLGRQETGPPAVTELRVTAGAPGQVSVAGSCEPCDALRLQLDLREPVPTAVRSGVFEEIVELDPFAPRAVLEITSLRRGVAGGTRKHVIEITDLARTWRQNLVATVSRVAGRVLPVVERGVGPTTLSSIRKDLEELAVFSRTASVHLLEKHLVDTRESIAERMGILRQVGNLIEALGRLARENPGMPDWERPFWALPVQFSMHRPFAARNRVRQPLQDPHHLVTEESMLRFHRAQYATGIQVELVLPRSPARAMLALEVYKFPRGLSLDVSVNGEPVPRCVMDAEWRGRSDDAKTRHYLELLPGLLREGANQVVITRHPDGEERSLEPINVNEVAVEFDP